MAHFAEINTDSIVIRVLVVDDKDILDSSNNEDGEKGSLLLMRSLGGNWKQTSYNDNIRKNYAGVGYSYDRGRDAFIPPQPYPSWTLNEDTCRWDSPVPYPTDDKMYEWDEETTNWKEII